MKKCTRPMIAIIVLFMLIGSGCTDQASQGSISTDRLITADLVLLGGTVITVDPDYPYAEAVAVREGRIVAVGSTGDINALTGPDTETIELDGRTVMPGFIEGHGHFLGLGNAHMILDLQPTRSFQEIVDLVAEAVTESAPGTWILGRGWHQERWDRAPQPAYDGVATHHALSSVSPDNPVLLTHASGHASFANASALALAAIDRDSDDPDGGTIVRDSDGEPTGFLRQSAQMLVRRALEEAQKDLSESERQARFLRQVELAGAEALRHGITSFHDQGSTFADIDRLRALADQGRLPLRLHVAVSGQSNEEMDAQLPDYRLIGHGDHFLTVRAIKGRMDGALGTHGAWLLEPYSDKPEASGLPQTPLDKYRDTAEIAVRHGFQLNTHAIGDRGNREVLDVYADIIGRHPNQDLRWRVEHAQNLHPDDVPRFAALGVIASMQGIHATSDGPWVPQRLGQERARQRAYVWRSLLDADAVICNGTDVPVEPISPIASLHASITRLMAHGEPFFPEQAMDRMEALRSYTIGCATAVFEENLLGTITPGKLADLVVLDHNPLTVDASQLAEIQVEMTILDGRIRYRR